MKINVSYPSDGFVNEDFMLLKYALEQDEDFEPLIWRLRGLFGVPTNNLTFPSDKIQEIYNEAFQEKPDLHPKEDYDIPENATQDELDRFFKKNPDIAVQIQDDSDWRTKVTRLSTIELLENYNLPLAWIEPLVQFIFIDKFHMPSSVSPISLKVGSDTMRRIAGNRKLDPTKLNKLAAYSDEPEGILLNISARVQLDTLYKWTKKNWNEIEELMDLVNLPTDTHSQVQQNRRMRRAYEISTGNKDKYGRKGQDISIKEFEKEFPTLTTDYAKFNKDVSRYKGYIRDCAKSLKV